MPLGSLLLINQLIPHRSTENLSDKIRWSVDLRCSGRTSRCSANDMTTSVCALGAVSMS